MHSFFRVRLAPVLALAATSALVSSMTVKRAAADEWNKKTVLTVNEPIQVTDTVLDPGKYVLMLDNSSSNRHIVRIFNEDQNHLIGTVMAIPNYRVQPTGNSRFQFWETPQGTAKALRAWFAPGDNFGQEFPYPKHPQVLTAAVSTPPPVVSTPPQAAIRTQPAAPASQEANAPLPEPSPAPPEVAQNTPSPEQPNNRPPEQSSNNAAPQEPQPRELPQTASPYTWFGFAGVAFLGLAGLIRLFRWVQ